MRTIARALAGLIIAALLLGAGAFGLVRSLREAAPPETAARAERSYAAAIGVVSLGRVTPVTTAWGRIRSWRTAQIRPAVGGRVVSLSDNLRDGAAVRAGAELARIDPADYMAAVAEGRLALREAEADAEEAAAAETAAAAELRAARRQVALRAAARDRLTNLTGQGFASGAALEEAELALAAAEQALAGFAQAETTARLSVARARIAAERAALALDEAERRLADTTLVAPFDGVIGEADVAVGDVLSANQTVARLIDPSALEAELRLSGAAFGRLLDAGGRLRQAPVAASLSLGGAALTVEGWLDRPGPTVEGAGRTVFARLEPGPDAVLRPGDFVTAEIREPALERVAALPASAATEDGRILLVDGDDRLREVVATILRREGDRLIVSGLEDGARYVAARAPQLAPGVLVRPGDGAAEPPGPLSGAPEDARG